MAHNSPVSKAAHITPRPATVRAAGHCDDAGGTSLKVPAAWVGLWQIFWCRPCCKGDGQDEEDTPIQVTAHEERSAVPVVPSAESPRGGLVERPEIELAAGTFYSGQWTNGACHGYGSLRRADGAVYNGFFQDGKAHGHGRFEDHDGHTYEGQWLFDHAFGHGSYSRADGARYEGQWVDDRKSGCGREFLIDGSRFEGQFFEDCKHGEGTYVGSTGHVIYRGQFVNDTMDGSGQYHFPDGRRYHGDWKAGRFHGRGELVWPDGSKYLGEFAEGLRHGDGSISFPDGRSEYRGQWLRGTQDGFGVVVAADGTESPGIWVCGKRSCYSPVSTASGSTPLEAVREASPAPPACEEGEDEVEEVTAEETAVGEAAGCKDADAV